MSPGAFEEIHNKITKWPAGEVLDPKMDLPINRLKDTHCFIFADISGTEVWPINWNWHMTPFSYILYIAQERDNPFHFPLVISGVLM